MKINVTFEVESRRALATLLEVGSVHALVDYKILNHKVIPVEDTFSEKLDSWLLGAQKIIDDYFTKNYPNSPVGVPQLSVDVCKRYVKIWRKDKSSVSAFAFIDKTNGDVLKPAGCKAPAKKSRGNIYDEHNGLRLIGPYGPAYLR